MGEQNMPWEQASYADVCQVHPPGTQHQHILQVERTTIQPIHLTTRERRPLAKTILLASEVHSMHNPEPYNYHRAATQVLAATAISLFICT